MHDILTLKIEIKTKTIIRLHMQYYLIFYMHNIHADGITRKEYTTVSNGRIIQIFP